MFIIQNYYVICRLRIRIIQSVCVITVILCVEMNISLDNPGFQLDVSNQVDIHQADVPRPASGSSSSGESSRRSCARCHGRMSSFSLDRHLFCIKCRGAECDINSRKCFSWTKEEMEGYVKLRKTLFSKSKKSKTPSKSSSPPPRSTAPDVDIDSKLAAQLVTVNQSVDQKLESMSSTLISRFASMLEQLKSGITQTSISEDPAAPGPSVSQMEPPSLPHSASTKSREGLQFRSNVEDLVPHGSGLTHDVTIGVARHSVGSAAEAARNPPPEGGEGSQRPEFQSGQGFHYGAQTGTEYAYHPEEEDKDSIADPPAQDRTLFIAALLIHGLQPPKH